MRPALLGDIVHKLPMDGAGAVPEVPITGIACEPDEIRPGDLYVALARRTSGSIAAAVNRGAVAVVSEAGPETDPGVPVVLVQDAVRALGHAAARLFGRPARAVKTCGVTGSFGKSTVAQLAVAGLESAGHPAGVVEAARRGHPAPHRLQERLSSLRDSGAKTCVLAASARDLVLGRFEGMSFDSGVFLGVRDRDVGFYGGAAEYLDAKAELFRGLGPKAVAAFNRDDPAWEPLAAETQAQVITFGTDSRADVSARVCRMDLGGTVLEVRTPVGTLALESRLVGPDHVTNTVAALTVALTLGADLDAVAHGFASMRSVPGRLESLAVPEPYRVFIDIAPDPVALKQVPLSLRPLVTGRLIVVIGPPAKTSASRSGMALAAERLADAVIVTAGHAVDGDTMGGINEMMGGFEHPGRVLVSRSRRRAVEAALTHVRPDDAVLLVSRGDGAEERQFVRDWFLGDLEAEALRGPVSEG